MYPTLLVDKFIDRKQIFGTYPLWSFKKVFNGVEITDTLVQEVEIALQKSAIPPEPYAYALLVDDIEFSLELNHYSLYSDYLLPVVSFIMILTLTSFPAIALSIPVILLIFMFHLWERLWIRNVFKKQDRACKIALENLIMATQTKVG